MYVKIIILFLCFLSLEGITVKDKFEQQLGAFQGSSVNLKPVATIGGESIGPRSAAKTGQVTFDENGAAFAVNPTPSTSDIRNSAAVLG